MSDVFCVFKQFQINFEHYRNIIISAGGNGSQAWVTSSAHRPVVTAATVAFQASKMSIFLNSYGITTFVLGMIIRDNVTFNSIKELNELVKYETFYYFIGVGSAMSSKTNLSADGVHLSYAGITRFKSIICNKILKFLCYVRQ